MCDLDAVRTIVREENAIQAAVASEKAKTARRWAIGIGITLAVFLSGGVVKLIQTDARFEDHTQDGHPDVVYEMISGIKGSLIRIETKQEHIQEDLSDIKKKLSFGSASL